MGSSSRLTTPIQWHGSGSVRLQSRQVFPSGFVVSINLNLNPAVQKPRITRMARMQSTAKTFIFPVRRVCLALCCKSVSICVHLWLNCSF